MTFKTILTLAVLALFGGRQALTAQGSAFTYQGRLNTNGVAASGTYDLRFTLYDAVGNPLTRPVTNAPTTVSGGLFTVTLDFGPGVFTGADRSLEISVRTNGSVADYTALSPRQSLTPTPYALYATNAAIASTASTVIPGAVTAAGIQSGQVVKSLNGLMDNVTLLAGANITLTPSGNNLQISSSGGVTSGWALGGNGGTTSANFLGTTDTQPLVLKANNARLLKLDPNPGAPNLLGGAPGNFISAGVEGATLAGGGTFTSYGGFYTNSIGASYSTLGGGLGNLISAGAYESTIAGGNQNQIQSGAYRSFIGGGIGNLVASNSYESAIAGGTGNSAESNGAFVGGGYYNHSKGSSSTLSGGYDNTLTANAATIGGGARNRANNSFSTIAGGENNTVDAEHSTIAGGRQNQIQTNAYHSSIAGGTYNSIKTNADTSVIAGGNGNQIQEGAYYSAIVGGGANIIKPNAFGSFIGGGAGNTLSGIYGTIPGGQNNEAAGDWSFAAGRYAKARYRGAFVWADSQGYNYEGKPAADSVSFRCAGGVEFSGGTIQALNGTVSWAPGNASWSFSSDRNLKDRLEAVNPQEVLEKVSQLSISEWSYKGYPQRHIGAMAQDFHAVFPLNDNDKMLNEADLHGVALAAIQGLNLKLEDVLKEKEAKIAKLETEMAGMKSAQLQASAEWDARFHTLQKAVSRMAEKSGTTLAVNH